MIYQAEAGANSPERDDPLRAQVLYPNQRGKENIREMKNKDSRHVVLDFYDLLIEPITVDIRLNYRSRSTSVYLSANAFTPEVMITTYCLPLFPR
jgi:hypothetical protein